MVESGLAEVVPAEAYLGTIDARFADCGGLQGRTRIQCVAVCGHAGSDKIIPNLVRNERKSITTVLAPSPAVGIIEGAGLAQSLTQIENIPVRPHVLKISIPRRGGTGAEAHGEVGIGIGDIAVSVNELKLRPPPELGMNADRKTGRHRNPRRRAVSEH